MRLTTDGLIIKENPVGEDDRLVTVLTRDRGLVRAFVRGARKLKNRNASATGLLCYSSFTLFHHKDTYTIDEASPLEVFFSLRGEIEKLSLAQYFCEICLCLAPEETPAEELLRLILNSLHLLAGDRRPAAQLKAVFELRAMTLSGFMPDLVACTGCGAFEAEEMYFSPIDGVLVCGACRDRSGRGGMMPVTKGVLAAMRHITYAEFAKLFRFELPAEGLKQLGEITQRYLLVQTDRRFVTLEFYSSLSAL